MVDVDRSEPSDAGTSHEQPRDSESPLHPLLQLQRLDTHAEQLQHTRDTLPQRVSLAAARAEQAQRQSRMDDIAARRVDVMIRQKRLENEAAILEARADTDDNRLYSGEITAIRDLQALQHEVAELRKHQGELEERAIEALMEAEDVAATTDLFAQEHADAQERISVLESELATREADIDERLDALTAKRAEVSAELEQAALRTYDRLRRTFGPSTAVAFNPAAGCGCTQQMPAAEVARIKRCEQGSVQECSECGRLVLR